MRRFCVCVATLTLLVSALALVRAEVRTWTDASGQFSLEAEIVDYVDGQVHLKKADGNVVKVPRTKLSQSDQRFLRDWLKDRKVPTADTPADGQTPADAGSSTSSSGPWPSWRGPNRDGKSTETGLLTEWPESGPPLVWTAKNLGSGYSSVAVAEGKIYTIGKRGGAAFSVALNEKDGSELWATRVGTSQDPNATPTVDGQLVYALGKDGSLLCARADNGQEVWRKSYATDFGGQMMSGWGYSESPLVDGEKLICTPGGNGAVMVALNKKTGDVIWSTAMPGSVGNRGDDGAGYSSPVISQACGVKQYIQLVGRGLISVAADDGRPLWGYNRIANNTANIPTPLVDGDFVFTSSGYGTGAALLKVNKSGRDLAVEEVYFLDGNKLQNHHGGMVLLDGYVYLGHGHNNGFPACVEMSTGRIAWGPLRGPGSESAAVVYADGHVYFRYQDGVMALIEARPDKYVLKGSFPIATKHGNSWPHPVIANGKLYLRDQQELHCYDVTKK